MSAKVIELDDHRAVWCVGHVECPCGARAVSTFHRDADSERLECPKCGARTMRVTRVLVAANT